ncbi:MAG: hypothetical protein DRJ41_04170 [Thermoprotei archaeon]|nr:MAG: hypothetical protein DRJ41_04170 [Thermoprotei archaeon]
MSKPSRAVDLRVEDDSNIIFPGRISTLKLVIKNKSRYVLKSVYVTPPEDLRDRKKVRGIINGVQITWGGGIIEGAAVILPNERRFLLPEEKGIAYFLVHSSSHKRRTLELPLEVYGEYRHLGKFSINLQICPRDLRAYVYRPRYKPIISNGLLDLVREKILEEYGVPSIDVHIWNTFPSPRVQILFEGNELGEITGDVGSGFRHLFKINVHKDLFIGLAKEPKSNEKRWYWVLRVWFLWLDKSLLDEVPDAERIELWVNPDTYEVDWVVTDLHWKEVVYRGPVSKVKVKIKGGTGLLKRFLVRSYHPPYITNMEKYLTTEDSRDPNARLKSIYELVPVSIKNRKEMLALHTTHTNFK